MKKQVFAALFLMSSIASFGAGYQINLQGVRQMAMGGAGTAWTWDASTIFYNPGGLARLKGIQAYASVGVIVPATSFGNSISSATTNRQSFTPFNIYIGGPIQQDSRLAIGLGIYTDAGIGIQWPDQWIGRYIVQSIDLKAICFQPTIAYRFTDFLSIGAGFVYAVGSFDMTQSLPAHGYFGPGGSTDDDGEAHLHGNANGVGFNVGIHLKPSDNLQIGLTYRSQINMDLSGGAATFKVPASLDNMFPNTTFDSQLPLPQVASVGIGFKPAERLTLSLDLNYTGWNSFDSLRINFANQTSALQNMHAPRHYRNTLTPRIGANYKLGKVVSLMMGFVYDPTPVTNGFVSPDLPDADRIAVTGGIAIRPLPRFTILAAFEGTSTIKRSGTYNYENFSGVYKTEAATPALAIYYNF
jgi:long-chain fatty acid transport protein